MWLPGDPVPHFLARTASNPRYAFHTAAGRYVVLSFLGSSAHESARLVIRYVEQRRGLFDGTHVSFYGVSIDPADEDPVKLPSMAPGIRYFWNFDRKVSKQYGAISSGALADGMYRPFTLVLDPMLRVIAHIPLISVNDHNRALEETLDRLPPVAQHADTALNAPVLILPRIFEESL